MHGLRRPELPDPEGDARRQPSGAEEVLPQGTQAYPAQGVAEEVAIGTKLPGGQERIGSEKWARSRPPSVRVTLHHPGRPPGTIADRGVAQLVEHWSPKPAVERSSRSAPALRR